MNERSGSRRPALLEKTSSTRSRHAEAGLSHYAVKYNRFMGVLSDYFLHEE